MWRGHVAALFTLRGHVAKPSSKDKIIEENVAWICLGDREHFKATRLPVCDDTSVINYKVAQHEFFVEFFLSFDWFVGARTKLLKTTCSLVYTSCDIVPATWPCCTFS